MLFWSLIATLRSRPQVTNPGMKRLYSLVLALGTALTISACYTHAGSPELLVANETSIDLTGLIQCCPDQRAIPIPAVDVVTESTVGDPVFIRTAIWVVKSLYLTNQKGLTLGRRRVTYGEGIYLRAFITPKFDLYVREHFFTDKYGPKEERDIHGFIVADDGNTFEVAGLFEARRRSVFAMLRDSSVTHYDRFRPYELFIEELEDLGIVRAADKDFGSVDTYRWDLVYTGRSGTTVTFLYREFNIDEDELKTEVSRIRPSFQQNLTYDLSEESEIGYQGLRIEIREATNSSISYRIVSYTE